MFINIFTTETAQITIFAAQTSKSTFVGYEEFGGGNFTHIVFHLLLLRFFAQCVKFFITPLLSLVITIFVICLAHFYL